MTKQEFTKLINTLLKKDGFIKKGSNFYFDCESIFPFSPPFPNGYQNPNLNAGNRYPGMPGEREKDEKANGIKGKEG